MKSMIKIYYLSAIIGFFCFYVTNGIQILTEHRTEEILNIAKDFLPDNPVIVDCGAYDGNDSKKIVSFWPHGSLHAFEPDPQNFSRLINNIGMHPNCHCYPLAVSDKNGTAVFHQSNDPRWDKHTYSGSLLTPKEHLNYSVVEFKTTVEVQTITFDTWAEKYNIKQVDMLFLDMQGYELLALKNATNLLKNVKVIYTEVEFVEAFVGQPLYKEVLEWIENQGFTLIAQDFVEGDASRWFGNILLVKNNK